MGGGHHGMGTAREIRVPHSITNRGRCYDWNPDGFGIVSLVSQVGPGNVSQSVLSFQIIKVIKTKTLRR